jgi:hypothetical protein
MTFWPVSIIYPPTDFQTFFYSNDSAGPERARPASSFAYRWLRAPFRSVDRVLGKWDSSASPPKSRFVSVSFDSRSAGFGDVLSGRIIGTRRQHCSGRIPLPHITRSIRGRRWAAAALAGNTWAGSPWRAAG